MLPWMLWTSYHVNRHRHLDDHDLLPFDADVDDIADVLMICVVVMVVVVT